MMLKPCAMLEASTSRCQAMFACAEHGLAVEQDVLGILVPAWTAQASVSRSIAMQPGVWLFWASCIVEDFSVVLSPLQHLHLLASLALYIGNERLEAAISQLYRALNWLKPSLVCSNTRHSQMQRRRRAAWDLGGTHGLSHTASVAMKGYQACALLHLSDSNFPGLPT